MVTAPDKFLQGREIGVSISDSPDLASLGLSERHLRDVMAELARHLMSAGATLIYGGDLRQNGYTELLFEMAARYHAFATDRPAFINMLPWPTHVGLGRDEFEAHARALGEQAKLLRLAPNGSDLPYGAEFPARKPKDDEWADALSAMRARVTQLCKARIVLGGPVQGYRGRMPGIAEEVLMAVDARQPQPVYLLGGFGGCTGDISQEMGLVEAQRRRNWEFRSKFEGRAKSLRNGLSLEDNRRLARTVHTDELVALILRGLRRTVG